MTTLIAASNTAFTFYENSRQNMKRYDKMHQALKELKKKKTKKTNMGFSGCNRMECMGHPFHGSLHWIILVISPQVQIYGEAPPRPFFFFFFCSEKWEKD